MPSQTDRKTGEMEKINMKKTYLWIILALTFVTAAAPAQAQGIDTGLVPSKQVGGFINVPGFGVVMDRIQNHGFVGNGWDIKGRPYQTIVVTLNNRGPLYFGIGAHWDAIEDKANPMGGLQYDALHIWRSARKGSFFRKMELMKLPESWRFLLGPNANLFRVRPDKLRIDRDLIFNAALHISFG